jgi:hypothetical protein
METWQGRNLANSAEWISSTRLDHFSPSASHAFQVVVLCAFVHGCLCATHRDGIPAESFLVSPFWAAFYQSQALQRKKAKTEHEEDA